MLQCSIKNFDKEIQIGWEFLVKNDDIDSVEIIVKGEGVNHTENLSLNKKNFTFSDGKHGKGYDIIVRAKKGTETVKELIKRAVFLDYDKLPDLPIISIDTRNGKTPTFEMAEKPHGVLGQTSINNEVLECEMKMFSNGVKIANSRAKFRVRGNTSVQYVNKPYKLELNSAADLLELGNAYADKEWVLLNQGNSLNTYFVTVLANSLNVEWQPRIRYVNLVLNGEWQGCYILSESVKRSRHRVNISKSGFLFEYDPYFWRPNTIYFRTADMSKAYGYTFKYPKKKNLNQRDMDNLRDYLQKFEDCLKNKDEHYTDYIDLDSFATWIVVHDVIGTLDGAGSNMYFYKYDFDLENPTSNKIKRGPLWDFDSSFRVSDDWSEIHHHAAYMKQLFKLQSFHKAYRKWFSLAKKNVLPALNAECESFKKTQMAALQESWDLHSARWALPPAKVDSEIKSKLNFLKNKIKWIDAKLKAHDWK